MVWRLSAVVVDCLACSGFEFSQLSLNIMHPSQKPRYPSAASSYSLGMSILMGTRYASSSNLAPIFVPVSRVKKVMKSTS